MLVRVTRGSTGLIEYLETGRRADWDKTRHEKDLVVPLYGNRDLFKKTEKYLNNWDNSKKKNNDNYLHITLSFSEEDEIKMQNMSDDKVQNMLSEMVQFYIKHHTSGYDIDREVIAYAEEHLPKIKLNEKGEKRFRHIHLGIALYNPLSDTKLRTTFVNNDFIDSVLQSYINNKFGLTVPRDHRRSSRKPSDIGKLRKHYIGELAEVKSKDELLGYFGSNNIEYKEVKTKNNNYFKIINDTGNDVNLRGKGFEHIQDMTSDKNYVYPEKKKLNELEKILNDYYTKRIETITKRESKKTRAKKEEIYKDIGNDKENSISMSYQQKIFYKHYGHKVGDKLKGYYVDTKDDKEVKFINKEKNIKVVDRGDKITTDRSTDNLQERINLMIDIAEAKEWNIATVNINGSEEFKREAKRQIAKRLRATKTQKNLTSTVLVVAKKEAVKKPKTPLEQQYKQDEEEKSNYESQNKPDLKLLKQTLKAEAVMAYAIEQYALNADDYEVTADNKINNKSNRQKPKNVIDFLQKEMNITSAEAIDQCQELYELQPLAVDTMPVPTPTEAKKPIVLKTKKKGITDEQRNIYQSLSREDSKERGQTRHNLRKLSSIDLLHNKDKRNRMLLSSDERYHIRTKTNTDNRVQSAGDRDHQASSKNGRKQGGLKVPLSISICKDNNISSVSNWEQTEVKTYAELSALMKQYPYSTAVFNEADEDQRQEFYEKNGSYPEKGYRSGKNVEAFGNLLIYDIDNDKYDKPLLLNDARDLIKAHGLSGMIMPSRSHKKPKKVASDHQRKHGKPAVEEYHTAERYRIMIPINKAFSTIDLEKYREFQNLTAKALGLEQYTDPKALKDRARFYYKSPIEAVPTEIKGDRVMVIDKLEAEAIKRVDQARAEKKAEQERIAEIRANIQQYRQAPKPTGNALTYANVEAIINQPIVPLIRALEQGEEYKDGSYNMVKTSNAKYSVVEENVIHDFKSNNTYNTLTYLQEQLGTTNLNIIARELGKIDNNNYMVINYGAVKSVVNNARKTATNDKSFEDAVKEGFSVRFCRLEKNSVKIADQTINLSEIGLEKSDLINSFKENREEVKAKEAEEQQKREAEIAKRSTEEKMKEVEEQKRADVECKVEQGVVAPKEIKSTLEFKKEPKQGKGQSQGGSGRKM